MNVKLCEPPGWGQPNLDDWMDPAEMADMARVYCALAKYANFKRHAMERRLSGRINAALLCENAADMIYRSLPEWAKW